MGILEDGASAEPTSNFTSTALVSRVDVVTLDFVQLALRHEEMKQTETFRRSSEATKKSKGHKARVAGGSG